MGQGERRTRSCEAAFQSRRRDPRLQLDVDWFVESKGCSTLGRGLQLSVRGALLPLTCVGPFAEEVTLYLALPSRPRMFKALGVALACRAAGWAIRFNNVTADDLALLAQEFPGLVAAPNLNRTFRKYERMDPWRPRDSP
jgi:hypothetical protein